VQNENPFKKTTDYYSTHAGELFAKYRSLDADMVHSSWSHMIPTEPSAVLDIGAGSGRDAEWLTKMGHQVVAVEPANELRELAQQKTSPGITWLGDSLPHLQMVRGLDRCFGLILVSGVWFHLDQLSQKAALSTVAALLQPEGFLVITLREEAFDDERSQHPTIPQKNIGDGRNLHLRLVQSVAENDRLGRPVHWNCLVFRKERSE
jgi:SAM-dependent methyltransferase